MKKYYLKIDGFIEGPYKVDKIHEMVRSGKVRKSDSCWTTGMFEWCRISDCLPGFKSSVSVANAMHYVQLFSERTIRQHFVAFTVLWCISYPLYIFNLPLPVVNILLIFSILLGMLFIYRHWILLQGYGARVTPAKAFLFLFIPVFNIYWFFVAIVGLAIDSNNYLEEFNISEGKISYNLSLAYYVAIVIGLFFTTQVVLTYSHIDLDTMYLSHAKNYLLYNFSKLIDFFIMVLGYTFAYQQREAILAIIRQKKAKLKRDNLRDIIMK